MANFLAKMFGSTSAQDAPLGSGMAANTRDTISLRNQYTKYVTDTQSEGNEPLSFEEWSKGQKS